MPSPFVWFHKSSKSPEETRTFLESLFGFEASEGQGGLTMLAAGEFTVIRDPDGAALALWRKA